MNSDVVVATESDRHRLLSLLLVSYTQCPYVRWMMPSADDYFKHVTTYFSGALKSAIDDGTAFRTKDFGGIALLHSPQEIYKGALDPVIHRKIAPKEIMKDADGLHRMCVERWPKEHVWYYSTLACDPTLRGRGYAIELSQKRNEVVDQSGLPAYLEATNETAASIHERYGGFERLPEIQFGSSPVLQPMYRAAR